MQWRTSVLAVDDFSEVVAHIYDAAVDVTRWPDTLSLLARIFEGRAAQISLSPSLLVPGLEEVAFITTWGWTEEVLATFVPKYLALSHADPRRSVVPTHFRPVHCRQFVSDETLHASEIYKQALDPGGIEYSMYFSVPLDQEMMGVLSVMRGKDHVPFTPEDCMDFGRFVPHVHRAVNMHGAFHRCREEIATVRALLDGVPLGMMVVEDDELTIANEAARRLLDEGDAMEARDGRLRGATRRADAELRDAVNEARSGADKAIGLALPIDHAEPLRAVVRRLRPDSAGMLGAPRDAVALYVTDPRKPIETSEEILQRLFGLTAREAAVLRVLAEGGDLRRAAARLGVTRETVRTHVRHIMETTGARRQVDLVRMVLASPAWIAGRGGPER
jgi:DNA-binding CsgD family transcriptional regulator